MYFSFFCVRQGLMEPRLTLNSFILLPLPSKYWEYKCAPPCLPQILVLLLCEPNQALSHSEPKDSKTGKMRSHYETTLIVLLSISTARIGTFVCFTGWLITWLEEGTNSRIVSDSMYSVNQWCRLVEHWSHQQAASAWVWPDSLAI